MDHMNRAIADHISRALILQDRSKNWLADQTDIPRSTLKRSLAAKRPFNVEDLQAIAAALGVRITDLVAPAEQFETPEKLAA